MLVENRLRFSNNTKYYRSLFSKGFQGV
ncbi:RNA helicase, partial [Enterococcus faecium]